MSSLNVVCLISGGKDSLFSILHCQKNGHNVVALANLHPPHHTTQNPVDDLDSYMYQTIGHAVIPLYEQALGIPLYRQEIYGAAVNQDKCYGPGVEDDETEALVPLLRRVQSDHPEVNAVSTGAILSDYQRTRVESVAIRLGLTPLSFLWQYPNLPPHTPTSLLSHMAAVRQDSRIVKVASGGLDDSFLWQNVANSRTIVRLENAAKRFGSTDDGAVLGEGGEYETLAIAGPPCLWKGELIIDDCDMKFVAGDAGSASVHITNAHVSPSEASMDNLDSLHVPALLEPLFETVFDELKHQEYDTLSSSDVNDDTRLVAGLQKDKALQKGGNGQHPHFIAHVTGEGSTAAEEMRSIMNKIQEAILDLGYIAKDVVCTSIILRDMADFTTINPVYSTSFRHPNPPARVTIACASVLPPNKRVMVSLTMAHSPESGVRRGLHVQSRSYWAPANIGPYSQAIATPYEGSTPSGTASLIYIAGQIPLIPATMELAGARITNGSDGREPFLLQAVVALQHAIRIARVMQVRQWAGAIAFIAAADTRSARLRATIAHRTWEALHRLGEACNDDGETEDTDLWEVRFGANRSLGGSDEQSKRPSTVVPKPSALHVVRVDALPRDAAIEWVVYGMTLEAGTHPAIHQHQDFLTTFARLLVPAG